MADIVIDRMTGKTKIICTIMELDAVMDGIRRER